MESFKANLLIIICILGVGFLGYWAVSSIQSKNAHMAIHTAPDVGPVVTSDPGVPVTTDTTPTSQLSNNQTTSSSITTTINTATTTPSTVSNDPNQPLEDKLQELIDNDVVMKKGSKGTRVGVVQQFLKLYGVKVSVDNDYGTTTVNGVKKFQVDQKMPPDGQAGTTTFQSMIDWLMNQ